MTLQYITAQLVTDHPSCDDIGPHYRCTAIFPDRERAVRWALSGRNNQGHGPDAVVICMSFADSMALYQRKCIPVAKVAAMNVVFDSVQVAS